MCTCSDLFAPSTLRFFSAGAVTRSLFRCRADSWALAENVGDAASVGYAPVPSLGFSAGAEPMYVAPPTAALPTSPIPAALTVAESRAPLSLALTAGAAPLNGDVGATMVVPLRAAGPTFDSGWFVMRSQSATQSYVQGTHGLATEPEQLQLSVRFARVLAWAWCWELQGTADLPKPSNRGLIPRPVCELKRFVYACAINCLRR
jgi:hypothetical protein